MNIDQYDDGAVETRLAGGADRGDGLLLQIRSDRRLGHEWDDWDGAPLPHGGVFDTRETLFFQLAAIAGLACVGMGSLVLWLVGPRLGLLWTPLTRYLAVGLFGLSALWVVWLVAVGTVIRTGKNWLPARLAERGLVPWLMPRFERVAMLIGFSRDRAGNAMMRVFNRLSIARAGKGISPEELLILLPRCLGKEAMQQAMSVSARYGVPLFVAARGRYARQMIAMRRPRGVVAVACERDLVSGVHDVAARLPVLGTTLSLRDGPCRNTDFEVGQLEGQIRKMLGLA
jgi:uncharacterized protein